MAEISKAVAQPDPIEIIIEHGSPKLGASSGTKTGSMTIYDEDGISDLIVSTPSHDVAIIIEELRQLALDFDKVDILNYNFRATHQGVYEKEDFTDELNNPTYQEKGT